MNAMNAMRRALLFLGALACHHEGKEETASPIQVHCVHPTMETIEETVSLRGRTEPPPGGDLPVASQVSGRIVSVAVSEGQRISAGNVVATVDEGPSRDARRWPRRTWREGRLDGSRFALPLRAS
jgi:multidrug efflux pump subunit AcrA (membrane-fusion protein)